MADVESSEVVDDTAGREQAAQQMWEEARRAAEDERAREDRDVDAAEM